MIRKSTNLLLTRTLASGLQSLVNKPSLGLTEVGSQLQAQLICRKVMCFVATSVKSHSVSVRCPQGCDCIFKCMCAFLVCSVTIVIDNLVASIQHYLTVELMFLEACNG